MINLHIKIEGYKLSNLFISEKIDTHSGILAFVGQPQWGCPTGGWGLIRSEILGLLEYCSQTSLDLCTAYGKKSRWLRRKQFPCINEPQRLQARRQNQQWLSSLLRSVEAPCNSLLWLGSVGAKCIVTSTRSFSSIQRVHEKRVAIFYGQLLT